MKADWLDAIARMQSRKPKISTYFGFKLKPIATLILPINRDLHGLHQNRSRSVDDHRKLLLFCEKKMKAPFLGKVLKLPSWERWVENVGVNGLESDGQKLGDSSLIAMHVKQSQKRVILSTRWTYQQTNGSRWRAHHGWPGLDIVSH